MIRVERDPEFWTQIAQHPVVAGLLGHFTSAQIADVIALPTVLPLAAEHGGFLFSGIDSASRVAELHTLFAPEGWGREVHQAAKEAFDHVFGVGVDMVLTYEMAGNAHSRPPRSFGFRPMSEMKATPYGDGRLWMLSHEAWLASPGRRRTCH